MPSAERTLTSTEHKLDLTERGVLTGVARSSIECGLRGEAHRVDPSAHSPALRERRASFVTLHKRGERRGCIGALEAQRPLVEDVARSAHGAAFGDPRFPALRAEEFQELEIHISVLSSLEVVAVQSRDELIASLRPKIDGLLLQQGTLRGTFLPSVWESLPDPHDFLHELERKAGLGADPWSLPIECLRYTTQEW